MRCLDANCIYTNVAMTEDGDVWWEGLTKEPPAGKITTWRGQTWSKESGEPKPDLAHPNSRFTAPSNQCPVSKQRGCDGFISNRYRLRVDP